MADPRTGFALGQIGGRIIRHIVDGDRIDHQAELAATMFEETGHPTGAQIARVLRQSPEDGFTILQNLGGTRAAYDRILQMQQSAQEQGALDAQNQATIRLSGAGGGGIGAPQGGPGPLNQGVPGPGVAGGRIPVQMPSREDVGGILLDAAKGGADLGVAVKNAKAARELMAPDPSVAADALSAIVAKAGTGLIGEGEYRALVQEARAARIPVSDLNAALQGRPNSVPDAPAAQAPTVIANNLRGEFKSTSQQFVAARDGYRRVQAAAADDTPAGNMALVFGFMKLLDPGSTVREGEYATAENARSVPDTVRNAYNRAINGERLTEIQRSNFAKTAKRQFSSYSQGQRELEREYERIAKASGVSPDQVVVDYFGESRADAEVAAQKVEVPAGLPEGSTPVGDGSWTLPNGRVVRPKAK